MQPNRMTISLVLLLGLAAACSGEASEQPVPLTLAQGPLGSAGEISRGMLQLNGDDAITGRFEAELRPLSATRDGWTPAHDGLRLDVTLEDVAIQVGGQRLPAVAVTQTRFAPGQSSPIEWIVATHDASAREALSAHCGEDVRLEATATVRATIAETDPALWSFPTPTLTITRVREDTRIACDDEPGRPMRVPADLLDQLPDDLVVGG